MTEYYVSFITVNGDYETVGVHAYNEEDAETQARDEFWNISTIVEIKKTRQ